MNTICESQESVAKQVGSEMKVVVSNAKSKFVEKVKAFFARINEAAQAKDGENPVHDEFFRHACYGRLYI